jgi:hypothetical protein
MSALSPPSTDSQQAPIASVVLAPRIWVPLGVIVLGLLSLGLRPWWNAAPWLALVVSLFGLFLLIQSQILRLEFEAEALVVWRQEQELRRFPYADWLEWKVFWSGVPVLFYFRERQSIHLLPMLFDAITLRDQLIRRVPLSSSASAASDG